MTDHQPKHTILVVEDEPALRRALKAKLTHEGFTVLEAKDGKEGLAIARKEHPALILLDVIMPVMDGLTMAAKLREDTWGKYVPIILLTNLAEDSKVAQAVEHAVYDYLVKSDWKLEDVVKKVKEKLGL